MSERSLVIREIDPTSLSEVTLIAERMRETLVEVLGAQEGQDMYTIKWLIERVKWHLNPDEVIGQVFVAENAAGEVVGHTIVRIDDDGEGQAIGLFSTTFVDPASRNLGTASALLARGERWMIEQGMREALTYTEEGNIKLQKLYLGHGYTMSPMPKRFVKLAKPLN